MPTTTTAEANQYLRLADLPPPPPNAHEDEIARAPAAAFQILDSQ